MRLAYKSIIIVLALLIIPVILLALIPAPALKLSIRLPTGIEYRLGPFILVLSTTGDIMTLSEFFGMNPLVGPIVMVVLATGLILFTVAVIQTWNLSSLVSRGALWEDWRYIAIAVAALLYAGYLTLVCFVWAVINNNYGIFNNPIFLVPVISSLILAPALITVSFYRFRKKAEDFVKTLE